MRYILAIITVLLILYATGAAAWELVYYQGKYLRYQDGSLPARHAVEDVGTPDCDDEFAAIEASLETWTVVPTAYFEFEYDGTTSEHGTYGNGTSLIYWEEVASNLPYGGGYIAVNTIYFAFWDSERWAIYENDICMNGANYSWSDSGEPGRMDVQNIATHETGHDLALADLYTSDASEYTMYGYAAYGEVKKRTLEHDDRAGISSDELYGYNGITLESFEAKADGDRIAVTWTVSLETGLAGYNLYRALDGSGEFIKVNDALITGKSPYHYEDREFEPRRTYKYLLDAVDLSGGSEEYGPVYVTAPGGEKAVFALGQNAPNPATTGTTFRFSVPEAGPTSLVVYDITGRKVATLLKSPVTEGEHELEWNLVSDTGTKVAPGVYISRLSAGTASAARKIVVQ